MTTEATSEAIPIRHVVHIRLEPSLDDDLRRSVADAIDAGVDHVSAYALIVEEGTPLARRVPPRSIASH